MSYDLASESFLFIMDFKNRNFLHRVTHAVPKRNEKSEAAQRHPRIHLLEWTPT